MLCFKKAIKLPYVTKIHQIIYFSLDQLLNSSDLKMQKQHMKTPKRQRRNLKHCQSEQEQQKVSKKRKTSQKLDETIKQKIGTNQNLQIECFICASPYNLNRKVPVVACSNNHTFCLNCITMSISALKPNCPLCRSKMQPTELNLTLYKQVLASYKQKNKHLQAGQLEKSFVKLGLKKFGKNHSCLNDLEILPRSTKVVKIKNNKEPSLLVLEPDIKDQSIQSFKFRYFPSQKIQVSFGVCVYDKFLMKMVDNCGFDTKIIEFFMKRNDLIIKANSKKGLQIVVNVNLQKYEIHWFSEKETIKKGQNEFHLISTQPIEISHKVGDLSYYPYCVLYNVGDMIELNK